MGTKRRIPRSIYYVPNLDLCPSATSAVTLRRVCHLIPFTDKVSDPLHPDKVCHLIPFWQSLPSYPLHPDKVCYLIPFWQNLSSYPLHLDKFCHLIFVTLARSPSYFRHQLLPYCQNLPAVLSPSKLEAAPLYPLHTNKVCHLVPTLSLTRSDVLFLSH